jgi:hypothetical protein
MISLQIHIKLVIQILKINSQPLKINTLVLLFEKFRTFTGDWLAKCQPTLHRVVSELVTVTIGMLKEKQTE